MSCRDPDPTPAPRGAHSYHSCLATPPFRPCRTGGPFSDTKTGPRTRIPGRLFTSRARCLRSPRLRASAAERNWSIYGKIKPKVSPRSARSSGATPRPTSLEARLLLGKAQDAG